MKKIERTFYLNRLRGLKDTPDIKIITGIRRSGKSELMKDYINYIKESDKKANIIYVDFYDLEFDGLKDYKELNKYIKERISAKKNNYLFIDEVQLCKGFELTINSIHNSGECDIYITGSNAFLLSSDLSTLFTGRYIEIKMLPLSFKEYAKLQKTTRSNDELFTEYMADGGFPYIATMDRNKEKIDTYLEGIYNTIIIKDIEERQVRKGTEKRKVTDLSLLKNISRFLSGSVGNLISIKSVSDYIVSPGRKVRPNTVADYIDVLTEAFIFYPVERFDIQGKQLLQQNQKYYIADTGLRRYMLPKKSYDIGFTLENIIYLELCRRGYKVYVGKNGVKEVDFVAKKNDVIEYFQVTASMIDEKTFNREITPLNNIRDHYLKTILTLDRFSPGNYNGIIVENAVDWLMK